MDMSGKEKLGLEKRTTDDQCSSTLAPMVSPISNVGINHVIPMAPSPCTSIPMVDSFSSGLWSHQPLIFPNMAFSESRNSPSSANSAKLTAMSSRGLLFPTVPGFIHPSLSHFPTDTAFIERAARLSCFNGGSISGLINPLGQQPPAMATYSSVLKDVICDQQLQKSELGATEVGDASLHVDGRPSTVNPSMNQGDKGNSRVQALNSGIHEDNFTEVGQTAVASSPNAVDDSSPSDVLAKKRKRMDQSTELDQSQHGPSSSLDTATKSAKSKLKPEQNSPKSGEKNVKDCSEAPKEDYVHVRARRGQATNSHSLAERVRREKISERMKYLQDLVPGCSKVTGKAVMLDEIINYVQSLQRQVEFLSMKLAAVNPRFDYNIEGLLAKDFLHSHGSSLSTSGFSQVHPQLLAHQQGFGQVGTSGMVNPSDSSRKVMTTQLTNMNGYKIPILQMQNPWNVEIHNASSMTYNANPPLDAQELNSEPNDSFQIGGNSSG